MRTAFNPNASISVCKCGERRVAAGNDYTAGGFKNLHGAKILFKKLLSTFSAFWERRLL